MMYFDSTTRAQALLAAVALASACGDDDADSCETDCGPPGSSSESTTSADASTGELPDGGTTTSSTSGPGTSTTAAATTTSTSEGGSSGDEGSTGPDPVACEPGTELVVDGGFEAGAAPQNQNWTLQSVAYGEDIIGGPDSVSPGWPAQSGEGMYWLWLGVSPGGDTADAIQEIELHQGAATLSFDLYLGWAPVDTTDVLQIWLGDDVVWELDASEAAAYVDAYVPVTVDVSDFADGTAKDLRVHAEVAANPAWGGGPTDPLTQYQLDNVSIVCE